MSSRTDQGLPAKITDPVLLEEGARILSSAVAREGAADGSAESKATAPQPVRRGSARRLGAARSTRRAS